MHVKVNENDLFEVIWKKVGCEYMSDLTQEPYREQAIREAKNINLSAFKNEQVEDLCKYLSVSHSELANG